MYFIETSAKDAENINKLFMQIAEDLTRVRIANMYCPVLVT